MSRRLIEFIIIFAVFLLFVIFNLGNKCDINLGFTRIREAPVFLTILISFFAGMLCTIPAIIRLSRKNKSNDPPGRKTGAKINISDMETEKNSFSDSSHYGID